MDKNGSVEVVKQVEVAKAKPKVKVAAKAVPKSTRRRQSAAFLADSKAPRSSSSVPKSASHGRFGPSQPLKGSMAWHGYGRAARYRSQDPNCRC